MSKEAWKWILEEALTDHELVKLANESNIKPQGFTRQLSVDKTFSTMIRSKLLKTMQSRSITKVLTTWNNMSKNEKKLKDYRGLTVEELTNKIKNMDDLKNVLISLLSSGESEIQAKGEELFSIFKNSNQMIVFKERKQKEIEAQIEAQAEQDQVEKEKKQDDLNNKKITSLQKTIMELRATNNKLKTEKEEQRKLYEQERSDIEKELAEVKRQLAQAAPEKMKAKHEQKQSEWEKEQKALHQKIAQQESVVKKQKVQIEQLDQKVRVLESELLPYKTQEVDLDQSKDNQSTESAVTASGEKATVSPGIKVALIAIPKKANLDLTKSRRFQIEFVELERLEQVLEADELKDKEQVWYLEYETPLPQTRKLKGSVNKDRLIAFKDYLQVKKHIF